MFSSPTVSCWTPLLLWVLETPLFLWKPSSLGFLNFFSSGSPPSSDCYSLFSFFSLFFASAHALTYPLNLNIHKVLSCVSPALHPSSPRPPLHSCSFCPCPCVDGSPLHFSGSKHSQAPGPRVQLSPRPTALLTQPHWSYHFAPYNKFLLVSSVSQSGKFSLITPSRVIAEIAPKYILSVSVLYYSCNFLPGSP